MKFERNEYPRPQFRRDEWLQLNGEWEFCYDDQNKGIKAGYQRGTKAFDMKINVPFTYQYPASGIGDTSLHEIVWYRREVQIDAKGKGALLCFNGSDYVTDVWVNGNHVITHTGAYAPFKADVTDSLKRGNNVIVVRCYDPFDPTIPRGKQSWTGSRFGCWYIPNTGIWQSVWMEFFNKDCIDTYSLIPNIDTCSFAGEIKTLKGIAEVAELTVYYDGKQIKKQSFSLDGKYTRYSVSLMELDFVDESCYWYPYAPRLFYVDFALYKNGVKLDEAHTRFGMRKISIDEGGQITLNNRPLYQRLILDQGYWEEGGITPPSHEALKKDIELAKQMGFNGARKHQKHEDPYFYYYAEELGFLTWCEMPSAYNFNATEMMALTHEWQEILTVARNFTSNIAYVPLNESWGTRKIVTESDQQHFARALYFITKAMDESKLISSNDGWEMTQPTDIIGIHDYARDSSEFESKYHAENYSKVYPQGRRLMALGNEYQGEPVLITEYGGIAMQTDAKDGAWGYGDGAKGEQEFMERYRNLAKGIYELKQVQGFCYTQLTDVQQEVNGLLYINRTPKFDLEKIRLITEGKDL